MLVKVLTSDDTDGIPNTPGSSSKSPVSWSLEPAPCRSVSTRKITPAGRLTKKQMAKHMFCQILIRDLLIFTLVFGDVLFR